MYKYIGFLPSVYCRYSSSATMSSVTAGTSCGRAWFGRAKDFVLGREKKTEQRRCWKKYASMHSGYRRTGIPRKMMRLSSSREGTSGGGVFGLCSLYVLDAFCAAGEEEFAMILAGNGGR